MKIVSKLISKLKISIQWTETTIFYSNKLKFPKICQVFRREFETFLKSENSDFTFQMILHFKNCAINEVKKWKNNFNFNMHIFSFYRNSTEWCVYWLLTTARPANKLTAETKAEKYRKVTRLKVWGKKR